MKHLVHWGRISPFKIILAGFVAVVLIGTLLLMLPIATAGRQSATFTDALFTSTSAVCVTGLIVQDTASYWSVFGQTIILILIQIGGLGVITVTFSLFLISGRKIGLKQRSLMQESISAPQIGGIVRLINFILKITFLIEFIGAVIMAPVFCDKFGIAKGIWYAVFHSVSAFCNAGFDLMGSEEKFSSLTHFSDNPVILITVMVLIVVGGIGFLTWEDVKNNKFSFKKYKMQSKVILVTTLMLIVLPAVYFYFAEFSSLPTAERIYSSLFQSVTTRTAGFNSVNLGILSQTGIGIMIILMLIGGSPGSTAGGMKTTTFAVLLMSASAVFHRRRNPQCFGRRIPNEAISNAATILTMYMVLFLTGGFLISRIEHLPLLDCLYETASAIGTVGLSLGVTQQVGMVSQLILTVLMFLGRVGGLTLVYAMMSNEHNSPSRLPEEKITVG